jgi:homoserine kinase
MTPPSQTPAQPAPQSKPLHLRLPATSANLGPGFDALGLAMALYLTIDATTAEDFHIDATGRDVQLCASVENNLILTTYIDVGCGSSASALLAGILLANHFGNLNLTDEQILEEACRREGHPDNIAACYLGGMTASAITQNRLFAATCGTNLTWNLLLALPSASLSTSKARALLPAHYSREDAVANVQATALLVAAFAQGRGDLLRAAMQDRLHQPYRRKACPLLPLLLPLNENPAILGVALSGAGPSVLLITEDPASPEIDEIIRQAANDPSLEIVHTRISIGSINQ